MTKYLYPTVVKKEGKVKFRLITSPFAGRYDKIIQITRSSLRQLKDRDDVFAEYVYLGEKQGVVFGKVEFGGSRLDFWATHCYYIAIQRGTGRFLTHKVVRGWNQPRQKGFREWQKEVLKKLGQG